MRLDLDGGADVLYMKCEGRNYRASSERAINLPAFKYPFLPLIVPVTISVN